MPATPSVLFLGTLPAVQPVGLPVAPSPEHFWAILVWIIFPSVLAIWVAHHQQQKRLRRVHRRLRHLEALLAASPPAPSSRPLRARPSTLTTRLALPATTGIEPPCRSPLPGR